MVNVSERSFEGAIESGRGLPPGGPLLRLDPSTLNSLGRYQVFLNAWRSSRDEARRNRKVRGHERRRGTGPRVRSRPAAPRAPARVRGRAAADAGGRGACPRTARRRLHAAAGKVALPLRLRPQGSRALLTDRGDAVIALGPAALRAR